MKNILQNDFLYDELHPSFIQNIHVQDLFGHYSYSTHFPSRNEVDISNVLILYGDNGSGKTTILRLIFNLLSPTPHLGRKSVVAGTMFRTFTIVFDDGTTLTADRTNDSLIGSFDVHVKKFDKNIDSFHFHADAHNDIIHDDNPGLDEFFTRLGRIGIDLYMLPDDRRIRTSFHTERDELPEAEDLSLMWTRAERFAHVVRREKRANDESEYLNVDFAVSQVLSWIRHKLISASNIGQANANTIYLNLVEQLAKPARRGKARTLQSKKNIVERLDQLSARIDTYARYGFMTEFPADQIRKSIASSSKESMKIIFEVLDPYMESIEARLEALAEGGALLSNFLETLNSFFVGKSVSFTLDTGFIVTSSYSGQSIDWSTLSSGEKQLLLMLCNVLLARDRKSIFLIDEPEISLNVKWQRRLIQTLIELTLKANVQFLMATHSIELLTKYKNHVVKLDVNQ